jgi:hypothetical protein
MARVTSFRQFPHVIRTTLAQARDEMQAALLPEAAPPRSMVKRAWPTGQSLLSIVEQVFGDDDVTSLDASRVLEVAAVLARSAAALPIFCSGDRAL